MRPVDVVLRCAICDKNLKVEDFVMNAVLK